MLNQAKPQNKYKRETKIQLYETNRQTQIWTDTSTGKSCENEGLGQGLLLLQAKKYQKKKGGLKRLSLLQPGFPSSFVK